LPLRRGRHNKWGRAVKLWQILDLASMRENAAAVNIRITVISSQFHPREGWDEKGVDELWCQLGFKIELRA
jgi:hypothetical protein